MMGTVLESFEKKKKKKGKEKKGEKKGRILYAAHGAASGDYLKESPEIREKIIRCLW